MTSAIYAEIRNIASDLLKKKKSREVIIADRKRIRRIKIELRRQFDIARFYELLEKEKSESAIRFLIRLFLLLFFLLMKNEQDKKKLLELRRYMQALLNAENSWIIIQAMHAVRQCPNNNSPSLDPRTNKRFDF